MQYIIQNSGVTFASLDNNVAPLVKAIDEIGATRIACGVIPFTDTIVGIDDIDPAILTIFYGSTKLVEIASKLPFFPGVWFNADWFNPKNWIGKRTDLLNEIQNYLTVGELRNDWINEPFFVKSVDPKVLTGMVLEGVKDKEWWIEEYEHLHNEDRLVISPVQQIVQEWRFFIVAGEVVTGSQYKHDGILRIREPISNYIWDKAREMSRDWMPSQNIVMDICKLENDKFKVVEFNAISCSGFYASPIKPLLEKISFIYN